MPYLFLFFIADLLSMVFATRVVGFFNVLFLVLLTALVGLWIITNQGWMTLHRLQSTATSGQAPEKALLRSLVVLAAGVLFLIPGLASDVMALLLLFPPTGFLISRVLKSRWLRKGPQSFIYFRGFSSWSPNQQYGEKMASPFGSKGRPVRDVTPSHMVTEKLPPKNS